MLFLIKIFPEISIKSRPVRKRFIRQLRKNIRAVIRPLDSAATVIGEWDIIELRTDVGDTASGRDIMVEQLTRIPGIALVQEVEKFPLPDMDGVLALCLRTFTAKLVGKTFAVRCKRSGRHAFKSVDVEKYVGGGLNQQTEAAGVKLVNPDVTVSLEIRQDQLFIVSEQHQGLGGFPLGCQDSVLSLISGGFDSSVSSYLCIKRGLQTHYCFFNLGGKAHELAVKEVALFLWMKYHSSHRVKFISVPFEPVVAEILKRIDNPQMGVILKRMMLRVADKIAAQMQIKALVTGESVAQVSSQTLPNLAVIDAVAETLVLRPLCTVNKQQIIDIARDIGTEEFSRNIPEYCAVISRNPTTRAKLERVERVETRFDFSILDEAVKNARHQLITELAEDFERESADVEIVSQIDPEHTIIDIRHPAELEARPLVLSRSETPAEVLNIPFYQLRTSFTRLDKRKRFLLFCDRGMMSRLHAAHLLDEGFANVAVLDLSPAVARKQ
ncbi:MAG: tRNA 4-thiouridine(8) synthase ThiI [Proteobacteria bacterium]|nr:tRNA 4-thiouridine(8) synthase ThiI [Pseudomonadota bacterium]